MTRSSTLPRLAWRRRPKLDRGPGDRNWTAGRYRVRWRNQVEGVRVAPLYYALVAYTDWAGRLCWEVISTHRKKHCAEDACERHARLESHR